MTASLRPYRVTVALGRRGHPGPPGADGIPGASGDNASTFPSRAQFLLADLGPEIVGATVIEDGLRLDFVRDPAGTAATTADGGTWSPTGDAHVRHWGVAGRPIADGAPTVDEGTALQAAFDWCISRGLTLQGDKSRWYGITDTLFFAIRVGGPAYNDLAWEGAALIDLTLSCIGGTWTPGTKTSADIEEWTFGKPMLLVGRDTALGTGKPRRINTDVVCYGNRLATVGIWYIAAAQGTHKPAAIGCVDAGVIIGLPNNLPNPGGGNTSCTDSTFLDGPVYEWPWISEADAAADPSHGFRVLANRTALGLYVCSADVTIQNFVAYGAKHTLVLGALFNMKLIGGTFFNGPVRTDPASVTAIITKGCNRYQIIGARIDDGTTIYEGFNGLTTGCTFIQFSPSVTMRATQPDETASNFIFTDSRMNSPSVPFTTRGAGTWGEFRGNVGGNTGNSFTVTWAGTSMRLGRGLHVTDGELQGASLDAAKTASKASSVTGKIVKVGDYGLGLVRESPALPSGGLDNDNLPSGEYWFNNLTTGTLPPGTSGNAAYLEMRWHSSTIASQTARIRIASPRRVVTFYRELLVGDGWSAWQRVTTDFEASRLTVESGLATSGTVNLDLAALSNTTQTIAATGDLTFTTSNRIAGRHMMLVITENGTAPRALAWPAWTALGSALPATISNETIAVSLFCRDTTNASILAAAAVSV
jgi:hypothetical protein